MNNKPDTIIKVIEKYAENSEATVEIMGMPETLASILIPTLVTIIIFISGILISWFKRKSDIRQNLQSYRNVIFDWVGHVDSTVTDQAKRCCNFSKQVESNQDITPVRFSFTKLHVDKINQIPIDIYIKTFVLNATGDQSKNSKMNYKLVNHLHYLSDLQSQIPKTYDAYQHQSLQLIDEWNDYMGELDKLISNQSKFEVSNLEKRTDFLLHVRQLSINWMSNAPNGRSSITFSIENLIEPLKNSVIKELKQNPSNDFAFNVSSVLQELKIVYLKWTQLKTEFAETFNEYSKYLNSSIDEVNDAIKYFESKTTLEKLHKIKQ